MDHPRPNLRYVDADDLEDNTIAFDGLEVDNSAGEKLGKLEGFIIDVQTGRPYHVVVGSGGWLNHKHFLLPIGHVALTPNNDKVIASVTKERVERYPGFDKDEFEKLSDDDLRRMTDTMSAACCPDEAVSADVSAWDTAHYAYPTWWQADFYRPDRADRSAMNVGGTGMGTTGMPPSSGMGAGSMGTSSRGTTSSMGTTAMPPATNIESASTARQEVRASENAGDTSPHLDGRAQPGDVLGVETGGERTYIGETAEDENKRRREAEEAARKQD
jgi:hypothetical protein